MGLTFNNQEWIQSQDFKYHDHQLTRISYANNFMGETADPEQREAEWNGEQPLEELPEGATEEEIQKKEEEDKKIAEVETEESSTVAKRKGFRLFLHGKGLLKSENMLAKFCFEDSV